MSFLFLKTIILLGDKMKIKLFNSLEFNISKEDIKTLQNKLIDVFKKLNLKIKYKQKKKYTIALIDHRYFNNKYITSYGIINESLFEIENELESFTFNYDYLFRPLRLNDIFSPNEFELIVEESDDFGDGGKYELFPQNIQEVDIVISDC